MSLRLMFKKKRKIRKGLVLMYHRIAEVSIDPWNLCVSPQNFEQQLRLLCEKYNVIHFDRFAEYLTMDQFPEDFVLISFDDGYLDNYTIAAPLLRKYNCPATFFITSGAIDRSRIFWWDMLEGIFLNNSPLPNELIIQSTALNFRCLASEIDRKEKDRLYQAYGAWLSFSNPLSERQALFLKVWEYMRFLRPEWQQQMLGNLQSWSQLKKEEIRIPEVMNEVQLKELSRDPLFEIGGHTLSHPALAHFDAQIQESEISSSLQMLGKWMDKVIRSYSYPFGSYDEHTLKILKSAAITHAFTTKPESVKQNAPGLELPRFHVKNLGTASFDKTIRTWYAFD